MTSQPHFSYKFILLDGENGGEQSLIRWERGVDRLCECSLLPAQAGSTHNLRHIHMDDEWEKFKVRFTVFHPTDQPNDELLVQTENPLEGVKVIRLQKARHPEKWMFHKYG